MKKLIFSISFIISLILTQCGPSQSPAEQETETLAVPQKEVKEPVPYFSISAKAQNENLSKAKRKAMAEMDSLLKLRSHKLMSDFYAELNKQKTDTALLNKYNTLFHSYIKREFQQNNQSFDFYNRTPILSVEMVCNKTAYLQLMENFLLKENVLQVGNENKRKNAFADISRTVQKWE